MSSDGQWKSESGFILSLMGSAIGFANILAFGSQVYNNGGGAFLIPFLTALFILGIPMLILEGVIGQSSQQPLIRNYANVGGRIGKTLGWISILAVITIGAFYTVLTGWTIAYTGFSALSWIPEDTHHFFYQEFLLSTNSLSEWPLLSLPVVASTMIVVYLAWYVLVKDVQQGIEKWCNLFLPLLALLVFLFFVAVLFLPGSFDGVIRYLRPDFSKLTQLTLWRDVFGQLFFSLSLGLGIVVGYSRHNPKGVNLRKAMLEVALGDFIISFVSGWIIFASLGYMAQQQGVSFDEVITKHSLFDIGYVVFPTIIATFGPFFAPLLGALFFFCLFIAGFTGVFSIIESAVGNFEVEFNWDRKRSVFWVSALIALLSIPFCSGSGPLLIAALEPMLLGNLMLFGGLMQILYFVYLSPSFSQDPAWKTASQRTHFSLISLRYICPLLLTLGLLLSLKDEISSGFTGAEYIRWGWFVIVLLLSIYLSRRLSPTKK